MAISIRFSSNMETEEIVDISIPRPAKAVVEFRPHSRYEGEYGFDWFRVGDSGDTSYKNSLQSASLGNQSRFVSGAEALEILKSNEYKMRKPVHKGSAGNIKTDEYIVPVLNLYTKKVSQETASDPKPPYEAKLNVFVAIDTELEKLEFEYDKGLFRLSEDQITQISPCTKKLWKEITVTCHAMTDGFDTDQEIKVWAYSGENRNKRESEKKQSRTLVGKLIVSKNSQRYRHTEKVILIDVDTDINMSGKTLTGFSSDSEIKLLRKIFYQSLTNLIVNIGLLDLTKIEDFLIRVDNLSKPPRTVYGKYIFYHHRDGSNQIRNNDKNNYIYSGLPNYFEDLQKYFFRNPANEKYKNYITVFCFNQQNYIKNVIGHAPIEKRNVVLYMDRENTTLVHELLHSIGLYHTFEDIHESDLKKKYIFRKESTPNIMDYGNIRYSTCAWQWQTMNKKNHR